MLSGAFTSAVNRSRTCVLAGLRSVNSQLKLGRIGPLVARAAMRCGGPSSVISMVPRCRPKGARRTYENVVSTPTGHGTGLLDLQELGLRPRQRRPVREESEDLANRAGDLQQSFPALPRLMSGAGDCSG
jgi:hypothetical protein